MSKFIVGDVHGCYKTLLALVEKLPPESKGNLVFVGDLIDRGPNSRDVVTYAIENQISCVLGNHEQMMIDYSNGEEYRGGIWEMNGGQETLESYLTLNEEINQTVFNEHVSWMKNLPLFLEFPEEKTGMKLLVSHSSADEVWGEYSPENPVFKNSILWDRNNHPAKIPGMYNVFGHTPKETPAVKEFWANIDTGCVFNRGQYHYLTCLQFPEMKIFSQENIETKGYYWLRG